jgi:hypothetical protein
MTESNLDNSRRIFLQTLGIFSGLIAAGHGATGDDPFDALPPGVWRNSRTNGLVMIRHPAPVTTTWHTKIVQPSGPGEPLVVNAQVFGPDGKRPPPA